MYLFFVTVISCILNNIGPGIIKFVSAQLYAKRTYDMELRKNLISLKEEMAGLNMMENFSKYAKLLRKYNKLEDTLKGNDCKELDPTPCKLYQLEKLYLHILPKFLDSNCQVHATIIQVQGPKFVQRRLTSRLQMELLATYGLRILNGLIFMIVLYLYWEHTIINLSDGALWPLNNILCWPLDAINETISVPVWLVVISLVTGKSRKIQLDGSRLT